MIPEAQVTKKLLLRKDFSKVTLLLPLQRACQMIHVSTKCIYKILLQDEITFPFVRYFDADYSCFKWIMHFSLQFYAKEIYPCD